MSIYHFRIKSDWHTKKGYIVSNSPWNARKQIELKTQIGENGEVILEKVSDKKLDW